MDHAFLKTTAFRKDLSINSIMCATHKITELIPYCPVLN